MSSDGGAASGTRKRFFGYVGRIPWLSTFVIFAALFIVFAVLSPGHYFLRSSCDMLAKNSDL